MNSRILGDIASTRMLTIPQGATYCGMGRTTFKRWAKEIGALVYIENMPRADKDKIDKALDALPAVKDTAGTR